MTEWYYASGGKQNGPVSFEQLVEIARAGGLDPLKDLVWTSSMKDWMPAGKVPGIFGAPTPQATPAADPSNPYAAPETTWSEVARTRHHQTTFSDGVGAASWKYQQTGSPLNGIVSQILSVFLSLGATRIGLNLVSGKEFNIGMLFEGGKKLLPALGATILYGLMVAVGLVLLVVPGIYLAIKYGCFLTAMVDRDLGVMDSFKYSSSITTNNRLNLFLLGLLGILIVITGCLALCVGMFFAIPVMWLSWIVAYRWMQYGHRAALDHPGTTTPMLAGL